MPDEPRAAIPDEIARVTDQAGLGLIRFDGQYRVLSANSTAGHMLERREGSLSGRSLMETFVDHHVEALVHQAAQGTAGSHEYSPTDHGTIIVHATRAAGGGAWVTLENVTELVRLRRIRSELVDNLSHELRTPLANVRLLTEMLLDDVADIDVPDRIRERVATIDVETGHLVQMINELLDLSRIEQASISVRHDEVSLAPLVEASLHRLQTFADRQGVTLSARMPAGLPPVCGDEERLDQLLMNLLHNAIKFSAQDGTVTVTADEHPDAVVISIIDEGVGIPLADQPSVFGRFYKVDRARQRGLGGTGLGLAIARQIAEAHDGHIWLESTEGEGSTFSFSVPFA